MLLSAALQARQSLSTPQLVVCAQGSAVAEAVPMRSIPGYAEQLAAAWLLTSHGEFAVAVRGRRKATCEATFLRIKNYSNCVHRIFVQRAEH